MPDAPLSSSTPITSAQAHTGARVGANRRQLQTIQAARGVAALTVVAFHLTLFVSESYAKPYFGAVCSSVALPGSTCSS